MKSQTLRVVGLLIVLASAVYYKFGYEGGLENELNAKYAEMARQQAARVAAAKGKPVTGLAIEYHKFPESSWRKNESQHGARYLGQVNSTLLVLPVQGDVNAFDPVERALISRLLVEALNQDDPTYAADFRKVLAYLGTNRPSHAPSEIRRVAAISGAEYILKLHAEHDQVGRFSIDATLTAVNSTEPDKQRTWDDLRFSDELMPSESFIAILPEVAKFAVGKRVSLEKVRPSFDESEFVFPESVEDLIARSEQSPLHAAAYLQMLGAMHPRGDFNETRDHLFERSLATLAKVSSDAPAHRYFKARAYAYLDRRPAAVALLKEPRTRHEQALLDALNGNLPNLQAYFNSDETTIQRFMALKDLQEISYWYLADVDQQLLEKFTEDHVAWAPLLYRSLRDYESWSNYSSSTLKFALDALLPSDTASLEDYYAKQVVVGDLPDELELTRLLWKHIEEVESATATARGRNPTALPPIVATDILDLVRTYAVANHIREVKEDLITRKLPNSALDELSRFESFFTGHPEVTLLRARALKAVAAESSGAESSNLHSAALEAERNGLAWTGRMTPDAAAVARSFTQVFGGGPQYRPGDKSAFVRYSRRYFEWPKGSAWNQRMPRSEVEDGALDRCIDYTWTTFHCIRWKIDAEIEGADDPEKIRSEILAKYAHRFVGHPKRDEYKVELVRAQDAGDAEIQTIQSMIDAGNTDKSLYHSLGQTYKRRGEYEKAQQVWLSYPGFANGGESLDLSEVSQADLGGALLFWIGQYELALPLLELAANSPSGSASAMTSAARVALINGDLQAAATWSAHRVRRYDSKYGLRDFMQLLHILGESETAWTTFDQFQAVDQNSQMWSGALVGHRMQSTSVDEIFAWIQANDSLKKARVRQFDRGEPISLAARYLLMAGTMDRKPGSKLAEMVADVNGLAKPIVQHVLKQRDPSDASSEVVNSLYLKDGNAYFNHDDRVPTPQDLLHAKVDEEADHRYTMLARAVTAFLNDDFENAFKAFNETAYFYYLDEYLPYYAFTASKVGRAGHISAALEAREAGFAELVRKESLGESKLGFRFDEDLTYAVLAGMSGDHETAMDRLRLALNNRPYLDDRTVYPMYQVVDLADRLFRETGEDVYRDFALDLSRRHTVVLPMYSWAYFIVAEYSQSDIERVSAAASGLHLDPLSHRAAGLDPVLIKSARELLKQSGPPYLRSGGTPRNEAT